jgi:hypothetical protein
MAVEQERVERGGRAGLGTVVVTMKFIWSDVG